MLRMFAKRTSQFEVNSGTDRVLFGLSLPSDSIINNIRAEVRINGGAVGRGFACGFALEMWILPIFDPDATTTYDIMVDQLVPKDTDVQTMDLDTAATDGTPFWEPGEADWSKVLDIGLRPKQLYHFDDILSIASPGQHIHQDVETPFAVEWTPLAYKEIRIKRRIRIRQPSVLVLGCSSPSFDDTTQTVEGPLLENEWGRVKYAGEMIKKAHMDLLGLTETGAETPWEEATDLLQKHLLPDLVEEDADQFTTQSWNCITTAMIDHSVKGELGTGSISLG